MKNPDASSSRGFDDRPDAGIEVGTPHGSEAVVHLAENGAGAKGLLRGVVGRRDVAVGDEDEQVLPEFFDDPLKLLPGVGLRADFQQLIELALQPGMVPVRRRADHAARHPLRSPRRARRRAPLHGSQVRIHGEDPDPSLAGSGVQEHRRQTPDARAGPVGGGKQGRDRRDGTQDAGRDGVAGMRNRANVQ